jgi:hypothetical protein
MKHILIIILFTIVFCKNPENHYNIPLKPIELICFGDSNVSRLSDYFVSYTNSEDWSCQVRVVSKDSSKAVFISYRPIPIKYSIENCLEYAIEVYGMHSDSTYTICVIKDRKYFLINQNKFNRDTNVIFMKPHGIFTAYSYSVNYDFFNFMKSNKVIDIKCEPEFCIQNDNRYPNKDVKKKDL